MEDTSLDDFLDAGGGDGGRGEADTPGESDAGDDQSAVDGDVEPAQTTYQWAPGGVVCAACGETVQRRWHSEDGLVCPDCKEW